MSAPGFLVYPEFQGIADCQEETVCKDKKEATEQKALKEIKVLKETLERQDPREVWENEDKLELDRRE